ncbi:MAG: hypothetical protein MUC43_16970 [Pirellula sp.]|jgi:hypothetical protein|nr:hypothetical protein [Pirellula sp.]
MDWQTIMALVIVVAAGVLLVYRCVITAKRVLFGQGSESSGCGSCSGCPSRGQLSKVGSERELVLVTLQKSKK